MGGSVCTVRSRSCSGTATPRASPDTFSGMSTGQVDRRPDPEVHRYELRTIRMISTGGRTSTSPSAVLPTTTTCAARVASPSSARRR